MTSSVTSPAEGRRGRVPFAVRSVLKGMGARLFVIPISAGLGIVNTRLIISHFGTPAYAQYGLLASIVSLLPFADLGMSAAVMNAVGGSDDPRTDDNARRVLVTALRMLVVSMLVLAAASVVVWLLGGWPTLLGAGLSSSSGAGAATLCVCLIALGLPFGFGQRILIGLHKNHLNVLILGAQTPLMMLVLFAVVAAGATNGSYLAIFPYLITVVLSALICWLAARWVAPLVRRSIRDAVHVRTVRGGAVFGVAWPTLVQMIALPVAMQTDRIVLSHMSSVSALAQYNLASQMFTPIWGVVSAGGIALWPIFARARRRGESTTSPLALAVGFGVASGGVALAVGLLAPYLAHLASNGAVHLPILLIASFIVFMIVQGMKVPLGMYLTDARGLAFQAFMILLFLPVNLGLSVLFARRLGAAGPIIGSTVGVLGCQVIANWIFVRRRMRESAAQPVAPDSVEITEGAQ